MASRMVVAVKKIQLDKAALAKAHKAFWWAKNDCVGAAIVAYLKAISPSDQPSSPGADLTPETSPTPLGVSGDNSNAATQTDMERPLWG